MSLKTKLTITALLLIAAVVLLAVASYLFGPPADRLRAGFTAEFLQRPDGYEGLTGAYDFEFASKPVQMDPGLMYKACADGAVDVICAFATDGRIAAYDLLPLEDDKSYFPPYYAAPLVRGDTLAEYPQLRDILSRLGGRIDNATMRELNYQVDREDNPQKPDTVARQFLESSGLLSADTEGGEDGAGTIQVGGKDFTEQSILAEMMAILIEATSNIRVERSLYLGGTMICFNGLKSGDLDLYAEYTGTGLVNILDQSVVSEPNEAYAIVKREFEDRWDLVWLEPLGFNNTYTLTMRREHAEELGIRTISDLVNHIKSRNDS